MLQEGFLGVEASELVYVQDVLHDSNFLFLYLLGDLALFVFQAPNDVSDTADYDGVVIWLGEKVVSADFHGLGFTVGVAFAGGDDDWDFAVSRAGFYPG